MSEMPIARTYNQSHVTRKYTPGKRRISIYWSWNYPWEAQRDPAGIENPDNHALATLECRPLLC